MTVYSRREFVLNAVRSALEQTVPVNVIVVEDCGPDPSIRDLILTEFGTRIQYFRNPRRRGLFDNWNACIDYCQTPWLSILHDDDFLHPNFIATMLGLARSAPDRGIYFGRTGILYEQGPVTPTGEFTCADHWREIDPVELAVGCFLLFPGQLFNVERARAVGGFRPNSYFTGDWDFWFRLVMNFGGAQSATEVSVARAHWGFDRGSSLVNRKGWIYALENVQRKRNLRALRRAKGIQLTFERAKPLIVQPVPSRLLLRFAKEFSPRLLRYNAWLFTNSRSPHAGYSLLQFIVKLFGPRSLRFLSRLRCGCRDLWSRVTRPQPPTVKLVAK